ncbi:MAG TPA: TonB-dependent receptor [Thermoanaerobaculia bacterium]|jgi:hypothetical protein
MYARALPLLVLCLLVAAALPAQTTASLDGAVTTTSGDPLPGVTVTVASAALIGERTTITGANGGYSFAALPPGAYSVTFTFPRAAAVHRTAELQLGVAARVDATLSLQTTGESIVVMADIPPPLHTPQVTSTLTLEEVARLPHQRNQLATAQLAPGVTANTLTNGQLQIAGGPGYDNLVLVNGVVVTENSRGQMRPMYVEDAIVETTLLTGSVGAEYGRFTGGVVTSITKSGGERFSGSLRDSLGNPAWSAQTPAGEAREDHLNHVFEATLGGRIIPERLWFFTAGRWAKNDTARQTIAIPGSSQQLSYNESNDQKRYEGKLTALLAQRHQIVASYFGIDTQTENSRFSNNIYDAASLTGRNEPESLAALHYDLQLLPDLLVQAQLSRREMSLSSGARTRDLIGGTVLLDRSNSNARFGAPSLCDVCEDERRDNDDVLLKASYFLDGVLGSHELVAGVDRFRERRFLDDHQSGSDFALFVTRAQFADGRIYPVITPTNANGGGTFLRWMPIAAPARENELRTDSAFLSDWWDLGTHWSLSLGARYDRNRAVDADGTVTANDRRLSPRLSVQYDVRGDGRHRVSASFAEYASRVGDAIASANQLAGASAAIDFAYRGPVINNGTLDTTLEEALQLVFEQFQKQGGTGNTSAQNLRPNGSRDVPGYSAYFDGTLSTPYVRELTAGYGAALGLRGFARVDLLSRDWRDFYAASVTPETRRETTPFGIPVDVPLVRNTNDVERTYRAVLLQARWSSPSSLNAGVHYTWSKLRGNDEGETMNGPAANLVPSLYYREFMSYERGNPVGYLQGDQRHRLRAWASYNFGPLEASVLQTFDSGLAYSIAAPINVTRYAGAPANPGYATIPNGRYFFSDRGALRTDDVTSTNLALRYRLNLGLAQFFLEGDLLNVFGEDAIADPQRLASGISTAANAQDLAPFDPFTTTPVEGTHYRFAANFGQPLNNLAYQQPRTYRFSLGVRF